MTEPLAAPDATPIPAATIDRIITVMEAERERVKGAAGGGWTEHLRREALRIMAERTGEPPEALEGELGRWLDDAEAPPREALEQFVFAARLLAEVSEAAPLNEEGER